MHAAGTEPGRRDVGLDGDVQLGGRAAATHLEHVYAVRGVVADAYSRTGRRSITRVSSASVAARPRHAHHDRTEPADLVLGRHRAPVPGHGLIAVAAVIDEREPLALGILEVERQPAVALDVSLAAHAAARESARAHHSSVAGPRHAEMGPDDAVGAAPLARHLPVEEREVRAGRPDGIGVEQMVRAHVVLIDAALHQTHAERLRVEAIVLADGGRNGREVVDAGEIHTRSLLEA